VEAEISASKNEARFVLAVERYFVSILYQYRMDTESILAVDFYAIAPYKSFPKEDPFQ
jgi:hypothetical protein